MMSSQYGTPSICVTHCIIICLQHQVRQEISQFSPPPIQVSTCAVDTDAFSAQALVSNDAWQQQSVEMLLPPSLLERSAQAGADAVVASSMLAAGAIGGAAAGETIGGDLALSSLGPVAQPLGQDLGRSIGRVLGGAAAATAIRCASRSRASSQVRFAPDISFQSQPSVRVSSPQASVRVSNAHEC